MFISNIVVEEFNISVSFRKSFDLGVLLIEGIFLPVKVCEDPPSRLLQLCESRIGWVLLEANLGDPKHTPRLCCSG